MKIIKKKNRWGTYYIVIKRLKVGKKVYNIRVTTADPRKLPSQWKITKTQMISILKNTKPSDWRIKWKGYHDPMVGGWVYDSRGFRAVTKRTIQELIRKLSKYSYSIYFNAGSRDLYGNRIIKGAFEVFSNAESFILKPRAGLVKPI